MKCLHLSHYYCIQQLKSSFKPALGIGSASSNQRDHINVKLRLEKHPRIALKAIKSRPPLNRTRWLDNPGYEQHEGSLVKRKPIFRVCDQVRLKPACAAKKLGRGFKFWI